MLKFGKTYHWKGIRDTGQRVSGQYYFEKVAIVRHRLQEQGILITELKLRHTIRWANKTITQSEILNFTQQLSRFLNSGISLVQSFNFLKEQYFLHVPMYELLASLQSDLESGKGMSVSLKKYPKYFNTLYCNLVYVSEQCGNLADQLSQLAHYEEQLFAMKKKVYKAMYYPIILLLVAFLTSVLCVAFVVPQFEQLFLEVGVNLPWLTQVLVNLSHGLLFSKKQSRVFYCTVSMIIILLLNKIFRKGFLTIFYDTLPKLPWISSIIQSLELMRFTHTLYITLQSGIFMVDALAASAEIASFSRYKIAILKVRRDISLGVPLDQALANTHCFPKLMLQTISTSQVAGQLEQNLKKLAYVFDTQIDETMVRITTFLEPALLLLVGFVIGSIILALYWPIFELGHVVTFT